MRIAIRTRTSPVPNIMMGSDGAGPGKYVTEATMTNTPRIRSIPDPHLTRILISVSLFEPVSVVEITRSENGAAKE